MNEIIKPNSISREELQNQIDFDLDQLERQIHRPGWNSWALVGALAFCIWTAASMFETGTIVLTTGVVAASVLVVLTDMLLILGGMISPEKSTIEAVGRFRMAKDELGDARTFLLLFLLRFVFVIYSQIALMENEPKMWALTIVVAYSILVLIALCAFILSFVPLPIAQNQGSVPIWLKILIGTFGLLVIVAGGFLAVELSVSGHPHLIANWKFGGLIWAIFILLLMLAYPHQGSALLARLVELRRKLGLKTVSVKNAEELYNTIQVGLRVDRVLQAWIGKILEKCQLLESSLEEMLRTYEDFLTRAQNGETGDRELSFFSDKRGQFNKTLDQVKKSLDSIDRMEKVLEAVAGGMSNNDPTCAGEIEAVRARMKNHVSRSMDRVLFIFDEIDKKRELTKKMIKQLRNANS